MDRRNPGYNDKGRSGRITVDGKRIMATGESKASTMSITDVYTRRSHAAILFFVYPFSTGKVLVRSDTQF
jgi:hypothetical protein